MTEKERESRDKNIEEEEEDVNHDGGEEEMKDDENDEEEKRCRRGRVLLLGLDNHSTVPTEEEEWERSISTWPFVATTMVTRMIVGRFWYR